MDEIPERDYKAAIKVEEERKKFEALCKEYYIKPSRKGAFLIADYVLKNADLEFIHNRKYQNKDYDYLVYQNNELRSAYQTQFETLQKLLSENAELKKKLE